MARKIKKHLEILKGNGAVLRAIPPLVALCETRKELHALVMTITTIRDAIEGGGMSQADVTDFAVRQVLMNMENFGQ